jgi:hypothetical protein
MWLARFKIHNSCIKTWTKFTSKKFLWFFPLSLCKSHDSMCVTQKFSFCWFNNRSKVHEKVCREFSSRKVGHTRGASNRFSVTLKFSSPFTCEILFPEVLLKECFIDERFSWEISHSSNSLPNPLRLINNIKLNFQNRRKAIKNSLCLSLTRLIIESHFYFVECSLESDALCMTN